MPYHEEFGIPGHLEVVVGQIGEVRQIDGSSFNGYRHMNADELKDLMARGWGVGNHSWTHVFIKPEMVDQELRVAKEVLEQAIDAPVPLYCAPGSNRNMAPHILEACRQLGYLGAMSIREGINRPRRRVLLARPQSADPRIPSTLLQQIRPLPQYPPRPPVPRLGHRLLPLPNRRAYPHQ